MEISEVNVSPFESGSMKAWVDFTFDNGLILTGWKLMTGKNGLWLAVPSNKRGDQYYDTVRFVEGQWDFKNKLEEAAKQAYGGNAPSPRKARVELKADDQLPNLPM